ncbi:MAG: SDR family oxidoreductase [Actinobacteria bacterium]|jgi:NAD(P)-dependent dehydrogenase (short-subunit alcohol dehydrogenase family)|nr:short-chain dehydrogenase [Candidatus Poribacteria bacterium]MBT3246127.1 SDR family oxidoreductase [Actinomycetota bacterium]MDP7551055.1 SDR family NAD(P)-dependent oxidoreductase [Acidimicrobiales bacterium]MBT3688357.1 SDR family oxidoreductase [Actinomycetota bacterium]MBT4037255.1 SDR family oxidoreductase [Actinomycetota bacterium]|tara:strand:+ start:946 stop:1701 length:756 start_codon:yes stop_codon:yes gene_type:complete
MRDGTLAGKVAVVTGGASGMGAATVRAFVEAGALVTLLDRDEAGAALVADETGAAVVVGDVSDPVFCDGTVDTVVSTHGCIDVLVNAAGVIHRAAAPGTGDDDWRRVMSVNVDGVFYMSRAAVRHMVPRGFGSIVNFGSIWGGIGAAGVLAYCASKGAVHQMTRAMALDHADEGVRINAVAPGHIDTPMLVSERDRPPTAADLDQLAEATIPMKRLAQPDEVAGVVLFLASDEARYITGAILPVDGGISAG